jgi:hypothetical protein
MNLPIKVKSPNNISKWQMEFNSAFKGLTTLIDGFSSFGCPLMPFSYHFPNLVFSMDLFRSEYDLQGAAVCFIG